MVWPILPCRCVALCRTSVRQVKDILSQMQSIPISQQNLVFRRKALHDDALLSHCGVQEGSSLSLVCHVFRGAASAYRLVARDRFQHARRTCCPVMAAC